MSITIKNLVKKLQSKNQDNEVEFIVVTTDGNLVCMDVDSNAHDMTTLLSMFNHNKD
jgi:hypothetical protein